MIRIDKQVLRDMRTVVRKAIGRRGDPTVEFVAVSDHMQLRVRSADVAICRRVEGEFQQAAFGIPLSSLPEPKGRGNSSVELAPASDAIAIRWGDGPVMREESFPFTAVQDDGLATPQEFHENSSDLIDAVRQTMVCCDRHSIRYAINCVRLDADRGSIAGTDGRQLLIVDGFQFPWKGHVLLPFNAVFTARPLRTGEAIGVGRLDEWIVLRSGPWTLHFKECADGHYPRVDEVVPSEQDAQTVLRIDEVDAHFAVKHLPKLPVEDSLQGITVDLNGQVALRGHSDRERSPVELILSRSFCEGPPTRFQTDRRLLVHGLSLGFRSILIADPKQPLLCMEHGRRFVWMPLESCPERPQVDGEQIVSDPDHKPQPKRSPVTTKHTNGRSNDQANPTLDELIEATTEVANTLRDLQGRTKNLIAGLKRHQKRSKLVRSTLASLKQLQTVEV